MAARVVLDRAGIGDVLKHNMRGPVDEAAARIAEALKADSEVADDAHGQVVVRSSTTDRASGTVTVAHPSGMALQAKYGVLTKAAAACGFEVHGGRR